MNKKPLKPCNKFGCKELTRERYCEQHKVEQTNSNRYYDRYSRSERTRRFYSSGAWQKLRALIKIRDNGLCQSCLADKRIVVGTIVDHIVPIKVEWTLRLTESNLQLLCHSCHELKTAEERK